MEDSISQARAGDPASRFVVVKLSEPHGYDSFVLEYFEAQLEQKKSQLIGLKAAYESACFHENDYQRMTLNEKRRAEQNLSVAYDRYFGAVKESKAMIKRMEEFAKRRGLDRTQMQ